MAPRATTSSLFYDDSEERFRGGSILDDDLLLDIMIPATPSSSSSSSSSVSTADSLLSGEEPKRRPASCQKALHSRKEKLRKSSKSVHFCEKVQCFQVVPSREDMSKAEERDIWYSSYEYMAMKLEIQSTIKLMMRTVPVNENAQVCYRGLEFRSKEGSRLKMLRRETAYDAVLGEQDRQFDQQINDTDLISIKYLQASEQSRQEAIARAMADANYVFKEQASKNRKNSPPSRTKLIFGFGRAAVQTVNVSFQ